MDVGGAIGKSGPVGFGAGPVAGEQGVRAPSVSAVRQAPPDDFRIAAPTLSLPKGGGAIRGMGEKFSANPVTGTGSLSIPIATSPGRGGFGPQLALAYDSGAGNGILGIGWSIGLGTISRKTDKGLPTYRDASDSDTFLLAGAEDLVPCTEPMLGLAPEQTVRWASHRYHVRRYRPRIEGGFACIERWTDLADQTSMFWRVISRDNVTRWFGLTMNSRIADPADPSRIFEWLPCLTHDDRGQVMTYEYEQDPADAWEPDVPWELQRTPSVRQTNRYPARIRYGNVQPYLPEMAADKADELPSDWLFELVFDYGNRSGAFPLPEVDSPLQESRWSNRADAFSSFRAGFEVRTYRLCRRVLMFHHMPDAPGVGRNCLVRSTDFDYEEMGSASDPESLGYARLTTVTHRHFQRSDPQGEVDRSAALPPVRLRYSTARVDPAVGYLTREQLPNLPVGIQGTDFRWVDLDGEGLSGVLLQSGNEWHFQANRGEGRFGAPRTVAPLPALAATGAASVQLLDLEGSGSVAVVEFDGPAPGFHVRDAEMGWKRHVPFVSLPKIDWQHPHLRFVDLTGDGHADALITEQEVFTWYPSLGAEGFGPAQRMATAIDERDGPRMVFADGSETIFLADMSGDGMTDLVRIRNGEVCWWPNLGHGRFGRRVQMGNAPRFDAPELYDPRRIRLADIDGSGPTDIIYLGGQGAQLYFNRSGNRLSNPRPVALPLATLNLDAVQVADLFGKGTACLVWSSHLPADAQRPVAYIDLMGLDASKDGVRLPGGKPHLLVHIDNSLGSRTKLEYTPSTRFYLDDLGAGRPWATKLPFPVHCVSRVTVHDAWRGTAFSSTYSYHHGYFDGPEREFRGFGRVEQVDLDAYGADDNVASPWVTDDRRLFQPPVKTVTWYHLGAASDQQTILGQFADEYFPQRYAGRLPIGAGTFAEMPMLEPELPSEMSALEWQEAYRACKGMTLRQEIYELDLEEFVGPGHRQREVRLYSVATHNCQIRRLQPKGANRHAVFLVTESEAITYHHELPIPSGNAPLRPDPRIAHALNLRHDDYGNVEQAVAIGYPRWTSGNYAGLPDAGRVAAVQDELHATYVETRYTTDVVRPARDQDPLSPLRHCRLRVASETRTYELTGLAQPPSKYVSIDSLRHHQLSEDQQRLPAAGTAAEQEAVGNLLYHEQSPDGTPHRRIIEHRRSLYFDDNADDASPTLPLPFGELGPRGLKYEDYRLAFTDALLNAVFGDKLDWVAEASLPVASGRTCLQLLRLPGRSGYVRGSDQGLGGTADQYWMRSGIAGFAADGHDHFFLPERYTDPFGNTTTLRYDPLDLYVAETIDARDNAATVARFDYRVLAPVELVDANGNHSEIAYDLLGLAVASAVKGKQVQGQWQADHLDGWDFTRGNPAPAVVDHFVRTRNFQSTHEQTARDWLGTATTRFIYHFGGPYDADGLPMPGARMASACAISREIHWGQPGGKDSPLQIALQCSDGSGAVLMHKVQAEPDLSTPHQRRWLVNGLTLLNNKSKPVKQYEPTFSDNFGCELPQANGVSSTVFYDAAGRVVRTEMPDGTFSRVEFSPWDSASWDANDTVLESAWYRQRGRNRLRPAKELPRDPMTGQPTWTPNERAGWLAAQHANTPARVILDSLGREVIAVAHHRERDPAGTLTYGGEQWRDVLSTTFTKLNAEGKPLWIRDALGHLVMQYITPPRPTDAAGDTTPVAVVPCYDMAGNLLFQHSMDAGPRWSLNDAAGKPLFGWDVYRATDTAAAAPQGRLYVSEYDGLHRPTLQWLKFDTEAPRLVEAFDYCDTSAPRNAAGALTLVEARSRNLIGQAVQHFDPSGVATVERVDLSGRPTHLTRRLIKVDPAQDSEPALDWNVANRDSLLEPAASETFRQLTNRDALGRMTRLVNWHRPNINRVAVYLPQYNARGLLQAEQLHLRAIVQVGQDGTVSVVTSTIAAHNPQAIRAIRYNAKGQKEQLELGNGTVTTSNWDPTTFRLITLRTKRKKAPSGLQDLAYTYDAVGNITTLIDRAQATVYQNNSVIEPKHEYAYDALYRLVQATGRENAAALSPPPIDEGPWPSGGFPSANGVRTYTQSYRYDVVGNFRTMEHAPSVGTGWSRHYAYAFEDPNQPASNRLWRTWTNRPAWDGARADSVTYRYDSHGSMLNLNRVEVPPLQAEDWGHQIVWDWRDMIRSFDAIGGGVARYHYGIEKQRARKHITRIGGGVEDRVYLGGFELYRRRNALGTVLEEIETHHLFEGEQRVLLVDDVVTTNRTHADGTPFSRQPILRYQYGNHLDSIALELDETAQIISYEELHPYGTIAFRLTQAGTEAAPRRYQHTGMERDEESGLSCHGARCLCTWLGVWISTDPTGTKSGLNVYAYANENPLKYVDRNGRDPVVIPKGGLDPEQRNALIKELVEKSGLTSDQLTALDIQDDDGLTDAYEKYVVGDIFSTDTRAATTQFVFANRETKLGWLTRKAGEGIDWLSSTRAGRSASAAKASVEENVEVQVKAFDRAAGDLGYGMVSGSKGEANLVRSDVQRQQYANAQATVGPSLRAGGGALVAVAMTVSDLRAAIELTDLVFMGATRGGVNALRGAAYNRLGYEFEAIAKETLRERLSGTRLIDYLDDSGEVVLKRKFVSGGIDKVTAVPEAVLYHPNGSGSLLAIYDAKIGAISAEQGIVYVDNLVAASGGAPTGRVIYLSPDGVRAIPRALQEYADSKGVQILQRTIPWSAEFPAR